MSTPPVLTGSSVVASAAVASSSSTLTQRIATVTGLKLHQLKWVGLAVGAVALATAAVVLWRRRKRKPYILPCRPLHWVSKCGNLERTVQFNEQILGMTIQRHEEFDKGCEATCNGPYSGWWSKTMMSVTTEESFSLELTYNYGIDSYAVGNDLAGIHVAIPGAAQRAREKGLELTPTNDPNVVTVMNPDRQKYFLHDIALPEGHDPFLYVSLHTNDLKRATEYYVDVLGMNIFEQSDSSVLLGFDPKRTKLQLILLDQPIDHGEAFGRIAFASNEVVRTYERVCASGDVVLNAPIILPTENKASVLVTILKDRDGFEICMVDEQDFRELSKRKPGDEVIHWQARSKRIAAQSKFQQSFARH